MLNLLANALRMVAEALDPSTDPIKVEREKISTRYQEARESIEREHLPTVSDNWGFRPGSKQAVIAGILSERNLDVEATIAALAPLVGTHPTMTFTQNVGGERQPIPIGSPEDDSQTFSQFGRLRKTTFAVRRVLLGTNELSTH